MAERGVRPDHGFLSEGERRTLRAICDTLLPAMVAGEGEDPELFALRAEAIGVPAAMEEAVAGSGGRLRRDLRALLVLLESAPFSLAVAGTARGFSGLEHAQRERVLRALATGRVPKLRGGFQALKRLACFLFFSLEDEGGVNPTWERIGYTPSSAPPPETPTVLELTRPTEPAELRCDVVVVGSGAGGSVAAQELSRAGRDVVVLEAGPGWQAPDFPQRELESVRAAYEGRGLAATDDLSIGFLAGSVLGGGTTVNWQTCFRTPERILDEWAERSGCAVFTEDAFQRSLDAVAAAVGVSTAESEVYPNNDVIRRGCESLGFRWSPIPRNSRGCDSGQCGYCVFGCRRGSKRTGAVLLAEAQGAGDLRVIPECRVERIRIEDGRATAVTGYRRPDGGEPVRIRVHADAVVVAAGAIHSPLLLMRSGVHGTHVGRHLTIHPTVGVAARFDEPVGPWNGPPQTIVCDEFAWLDGAYGFRVEAAPSHPGLMGLATPWLNARDYRSRMQPVDRIGATIALIRDRSEGRVTADREGRPLLRYRPGRRERAHLRAGMAAAARIQLAAGAEEVYTLHTAGYRLTRREAETGWGLRRFLDVIDTEPVDANHCMLFTAHQMGTCRMAASAADGVCGPDGRVYGVDGLYLADASTFPASSGVNPMLSIMAIAHHVARAVDAGLNR